MTNLEKISRVFKAIDRFGNEAEFELIKPNLAIEQEGEIQYRKAFSQCLKNGIFPKEKIKAVMREHEIWTDEDELEMKKIIGRIAVCQIELEEAEKSGKESEECLKIAQRLTEYRQDMWKLFGLQHSTYLNSAEGVSELIKTEAIMAACVRVKSNNQRYWPDYKSFVLEKEENEKSTVYASVCTVQSKIMDAIRLDLEQEYPEYRYLQNVQDKFLDEDVQQEIEKRKEEALSKNGSGDSKGG